MKKKWVILDKNAHWWKNSNEVKKWVIRSGDDYWIVGGSEFPEKKLTEEELFQMKTGSCRKGEKSKLSTIKWSLLVLLTSLLCISIAVIIFLLRGV